MISKAIHIYFQEQISSLDTLIRKKDEVLEEATRSSLELKKARGTFEAKMAALKEESRSIKKHLRSAQRSLSLAEKDKRTAGASRSENGLKHKIKVGSDFLSSAFHGSALPGSGPHEFALEIFSTVHGVKIIYMQIPVTRKKSADSLVQDTLVGSDPHELAPVFE